MTARDVQSAREAEHVNGAAYAHKPGMNGSAIVAADQPGGIEANGVSVSTKSTASKANGINHPAADETGRTEGTKSAVPHIKGQPDPN